MKRFNRGNGTFGALIGLFFLAVWGFLIIGWVLNVVKLVESDFEAPYKNEVIRTVGTFVPPIGGIAGWVDIDDAKKD